jgi:hypothetical protein
MGPGHSISSRENVYGMTRTIPVPRRWIGQWRKRKKHMANLGKTWPIALTLVQVVDWKWREHWPYEIRLYRFGFLERWHFMMLIGEY